MRPARGPAPVAARSLCGVLGAVAALAVVPGPAHADCATDSRGEVWCGAGRCARDQGGRVWCSRHDEGGVDRTRKGEVVCGRGACARTTDGRVFCSDVVRGAALRDSRGRVRCQGRCEEASAAHCESTLADDVR